MCFGKTNFFKCIASSCNLGLSLNNVILHVASFVLPIATVLAVLQVMYNVQDTAPFLYAVSVK